MMMVRRVLSLMFFALDRLAMMLLIGLFVLLVLAGGTRAQSYTPLGSTVLTDTNGVVQLPAGFWDNNVIGSGDIAVDTDFAGRLRIHVAISTNMQVSIRYEDILGIPAFLQDTNTLSAALALAQSAVQTELDPVFTAWRDDDFDTIHTAILDAIAAAADAANLDGNVQGLSSDNVVVAVRNIPISGDVPATGETWIMGSDGVMYPGEVATDSGVGITNFVAAVGSGQGFHLPDDSVGFVRRISGDGSIALPFFVDGREVGYFSTNGLTLTLGSVELFGDDVEGAFKALDGSEALPVYSFAAMPDTGWYRVADGLDYRIAFAYEGALVAYWMDDGLHLADGAFFEGLFRVDDGSALVPALSWPSVSGRMGFWADDHAEDVDRRVLFNHGVFGNVFYVDRHGMHIAPGKSLSVDGADLASADDLDAYVQESPLVPFYSSTNFYLGTSSTPVARGGLFTNGWAYTVIEPAGDYVIESQLAPHVDGPWTTAEPTTNAVYFRLVMTDGPAAMVNFTNVQAFAFSRPDLFTNVVDVGGQVLLVDDLDPKRARQAVNQRSLATYLSHYGALQSETDPIWIAASGSVVYASSPTYTDTVAKAYSALQSEADTLQTVRDRGNAATGDVAFASADGNSFRAGFNAAAGVTDDGYTYGNVYVGSNAGRDSQGHLNFYGGNYAGFEAGQTPNSASQNFYGGWYAGTGSQGVNNFYGGGFAGADAQGNQNFYGGYGVGYGADSDFSAFLGVRSGRNASGSYRLFMDVYAADPGTNSVATNDTIFIDSDGRLYLGGGAARAENPSAGVTLRGEIGFEDGANFSNGRRDAWGPLSTSNDVPSAVSPRFYGDELFYHSGTNRSIYRAFGSTTNAWEEVWRK